MQLPFAGQFLFLACLCSFDLIVMIPFQLIRDVWEKEVTCFSFARAAFSKGHANFLFKGSYC